MYTTHVLVLTTFEFKQNCDDDWDKMSCVSEALWLIDEDTKHIQTERIGAFGSKKALHVALAMRIV